VAATLARCASAKYHADGGLDIYVQAKSLGADKESNWRPVPLSGPFNLTTHTYQAMKEMVDETYKLPAVTRVP